MAVYDSRHINKIKREAVRRSQENPRQNTITAHYSEGNNEEFKKVCEEKNDKQNCNVIERKQKNDFNDILKKILDGKIDNDKLIIIALMILLAKEGADIKLIIALGYILL